MSDTIAISVTVNGRRYQRSVAPRTLLVHFLRDDLGLTGTHVGCETSLCGACTVLVDGAVTKACTRLAVQADGCAVSTIEGVAEGVAQNGELHPVQQELWRHHGLQCGYCTPGMVMAAIGLLARVPQPSAAQIKVGLKGNLCRCTGYLSIVEAVSAAAARVAGSATAGSRAAGAGGAAANAAAPEGLARNTAVPEGLARNTAAPEGLARNTAVPEGLARNTAVPEGLARNTAASEGLARNTAVPEGLARNTAVPEGLARNTAASEGLARNTAVPEGLARNTAVPEGLGPKPVDARVAGALVAGREASTDVTGADARVAEG